jgi:hypothetical protein
MMKKFLILFIVIGLSFNIAILTGACGEAEGGGTNNPDPLSEFNGKGRPLEIFINDFDNNPQQRLQNQNCSTVGLYGTRNMIDLLGNSSGQCFQTMFTSSQNMSIFESPILSSGCWSGKVQVETIDNNNKVIAKNIKDLRNLSINTTTKSLILSVPKDFKCRVKFNIYEPCQSGCVSNNINPRVKWVIPLSQSLNVDVYDQNAALSFGSIEWNCQ